MKLCYMMLFSMVAMVATPAFAVEFEIGTEGFDGGVNNWPGGENPTFAIDGFGQKYLNFGKENTGVAVTPASGAGAPTSITLWSANDAEPRDPASFAIYGTNDSLAGLTAGTWVSGLTHIATDVIALPSSRNNGGGAEPLLAANSTTVGFADGGVWENYIVVFPTLKDSGGANSMQVAEIQLNDATGAPVFASTDAILGGQLVPEPTTVMLAMFAGLGMTAIRRRK